MNTGVAFDPKKSTVTDMPTINAPEARLFHRAIASDNGKMLVAGGVNQANEVGLALHVFDARTEQWSELDSSTMPPLGINANSAKVGNNAFVWGGTVNGGGSFSGGIVYDFDSGELRQVSTVGAPKFMDSASVQPVGDGVLIWGGCFNSCTRSGYFYNLKNDTWKMIATGPLTPRNSAASFSDGNRVAIWGGYDPYGVVGDGAVYDLKTNSWKKMSTLGAPSARGPGVIFSGKNDEMIVWGGVLASGVSTWDDSFTYNLTTDTWMPLYTDADIAHRSYASHGWIGDTFYILMGLGDFNSEKFGGFAYHWSTAE